VTAGFHVQALSAAAAHPTLDTMPALSDIEIQRGLGALPGWSRKGDTLVKSYHFATFPAGVAFIAQVADIAEAMQHHPDIDIRYTKVHFSLSTHDAGGITPKDFDLARAIEELAAA
jgi:4a-hydroxytetrahydrobiopterin dehydratase